MQKYNFSVHFLYIVTYISALKFPNRYFVCLRKCLLESLIISLQEQDDTKVNEVQLFVPFIFTHSLTGRPDLLQDYICYETTFSLLLYIPCEKSEKVEQCENYRRNSRFSVSKRRKIVVSSGNYRGKTFSSEVKNILPSDAHWNLFCSYKFPSQRNFLVPFFPTLI